MTTDETSETSRDCALIVRLNDRPGAVEAVAAIFANRGVSIATILGNGATLDPENLATVLVTFRANDTRRESLRRNIERLPRVVAVYDRCDRSDSRRTAALIRLSPGAILSVEPPVIAHPVGERAPDSETLWSVLGPPAAIDELLDRLRASGELRAVSLAGLAL